MSMSTLIAGRTLQQILFMDDGEFDTFIDQVSEEDADRISNLIIQESHQCVIGATPEPRPLYTS